MSIKNIEQRIEKREGKDYLVVKLWIPLLQKVVAYDIKILDGWKPYVYYTATTGMLECIGTLISENEAEGYALHNPKKRFKIKNPFNIKVGERVIITEHINLEGQQEYLVSKHRLYCGDVNYVHLALQKNDKIKEVLRIDVMTGACKWL
ncbi:MAG: hypothetical protein DRP85_00845 [Candidatus Makaraimicrobium thalassicum]|nr:MAG: hypothetical protein DRP85_00845 [Candidatus Omnitrophota bacterium]